MSLTEVKYMAAMYRNIGYECIGISAKTGKNIDQVKELMKDKTSMISGHSGTGKSTLINAIEPSLDLKTTQISEQHKQGQHTTTFAEMLTWTLVPVSLIPRESKVLGLWILKKRN